MFAFIFIVIWKILKYTFITAAVLTYVELAPNGDALKAIVTSIQSALMQVEWNTLIDTVVINLKALIVGLWEAFNSNSTAEQAAAIKEMAK